MASLFGEIAKSGGGALIQHSENVREERLMDEEAQREMQLAKQRMAHDSSMTQKRIDADDRRETRRMEYETTAAEQQQKWDAEAAEAEREASWRETHYEGQIDLATAMLNKITAEERNGVGRGNGWTTFQKDSFDSQTGQPVTRFFADRDGITYEQIGDKYIEPGSTTPLATFDSIETQREAEGKLWSGEATAQQFKDRFGYVPAAYVTGQIVQGNSNIRERFRQAGIDFDRTGTSAPGAGRSGGGGGSEQQKVRQIFNEGASGGAPMRPSIEELSEGPERDAHIAAQGGKTNDEIAAEMRAEAGGGALSEAAAATPELTQGGNLDQPTASPAVAEALTDGQIGGARSGELSDEDALDIARTIQTMIEQRESVTTPQDEVPDPLGVYKEIGGMIAKPFRKPESPRHPTMTPEQMREAAGTQ